jgi:predicted enzyme related to lactoylglutathione lyase
MKTAIRVTAVLLTAILVPGSLGSATSRDLPQDVGPGRIAWFDLTTKDLAKSRDFYGKLFGWTFTPVHGTDQAVEIVSRGMHIGTLRGAEGPIGTYNGVVYVQVDDMPATCRKAKELGGTIPDGFPFNLPGGIGTIALVVEPSGHPIGMYSRTPLPPEPQKPAAR